MLELPLQHREIIALCDLEELPYTTVAGILACPVGTVRSRLHRARALVTIRLASLELDPSRERTAHRASRPLVMKTLDPHPHLALLLRQYARDLAQSAPSSDLNARIGLLVAEHRQMSAAVPPRRRRAAFYDAAAAFAALAIGAGIFIGMQLENARAHFAATGGRARHALAARGPHHVAHRLGVIQDSGGILGERNAGRRRSGLEARQHALLDRRRGLECGTFRIEQVVPADSTQKDGGHDGVAPKAH